MDVGSTQQQRQDETLLLLFVHGPRSLTKRARARDFRAGQIFHGFGNLGLVEGILVGSTRWSKLT